MFKTLRTAWKVKDLRSKMLFTLLVVVLFRMGNVITVPFVDTSLMKDIVAGMGTNILGLYNLMSGGAFAAATVFALGIQPYINASIIIQLLTYAIPSLNHMAKEEGEAGKKKIKQITNVAAGVIAVIQAIGYYFMIDRYGILTSEVSGWVRAVVIVAVLSAGAFFITWLGNQVEKKGIGNGISIILFAGIVSRLPKDIMTLIASVRMWFDSAKAETRVGMHPAVAAAMVIGILLLMALIIYVNDCERRIPVQYAKKQVGRRMLGGQSSFIPFKLSLTGVMPIIFAQSILTLPVTIWSFIGMPAKGTWSAKVYEAIQTYSPTYLLIYFVFIIAFGYFYSSIQYDPVEMANNLQKNGGFVPGFRPGAATIAIFRNTLKQVTLTGSLYLSIVALTPLAASHIPGMEHLAIGGTSMIILVSVALETVKAFEAKLSLHNYKGFLN